MREPTFRDQMVHDVPVINVGFSRDGDRVDMRSIGRWTSWAVRFDPAAPLPHGHAVAMLRDTSGRELSRALCRPAFAHHYSRPEDGGCRAVLAGWTATLIDHPDAAHLSIVDGDEVLWELHRSPRPPVITGVRAVIAAVGDIDHEYARHYTPVGAMLYVRWHDDAAGAFYSRETRWATPEQPEGAHMCQAQLGEPRGVAVAPLVGVPDGPVQIRVVLSDGFHVVESEPVTVHVPHDRAMVPTGVAPS